MINKNLFKFSGPLDPNRDEPVFIHRNEDLERVLKGIKNLDYYAIIAPRQSGKTTFLRYLMDRLGRDEFNTYETIYITFSDLIKINRSEVYAGIARKIIKSLKKKYSINPESLLNMYERVHSNLDLEDFLCELSMARFRLLDGETHLPGCEEKGLKFVIFIDEIDALPTDIAIEFIKTIRAFFTQRSFSEGDGYDLYSFILTGASNLAKLTYGRTSPFNIAERIDLRDFNEEELKSMVKKGMQETGIAYYDGFIDDLFRETRGHPCLTQKICNRIVDSLGKENKHFIDRVSLTTQIDELIEGFDMTLKSAFKRIVSDKNQDILQRILKGEEIKYNECDDFSYSLALSGAVVNEHGLCKIRNPIYQRFLSKQFGKQSKKDWFLEKFMEKVLIINLRCNEEQLSVSAQEQFVDEQRTLEFYENMSLNHAFINDNCNELFNCLNSASRMAKVHKGNIERIRCIGQTLFDHLLTLKVKELINATKCEEIIFKIDGRLVQIPWELIHDGSSFLSQRFSIGRVVSTCQTMAPLTMRGIKRPFKMLILADSRGDLNASYVEGSLLKESFGGSPEDIEINLKSTSIKTEFIKRSLREYDIIHFAGHAEYDPEDPSKTGWLTADGILSTSDIIKMIGGAPLPFLIFSNACQSGHTEPWKVDTGSGKGVYGLANAFLLAGVQHYVGAFWDIPDSPALHFSEAFYQNLLKGMTIGQSLKKAKLFLIDRYGEENTAWMAYMLYGNPTFKYFPCSGISDSKQARQWN